MADVSNLRKRRGAIKASITKLTSQIKQLKSKVHEPTTLELAQQLVPNLNSLDARFKEHHFSIIDNIDEKDLESLAKEQEGLDAHDEELSVLLLRAQQLVHKCSSTSDTGDRKIISHNFADLKAQISKMQAAFSSLLKKPEETHLYHHYQEQLQDFKGEIGAIRQSVLSMSTSAAGDLAETISGLDKGIFDVSVQIKEFFYTHKDSTTPTETTPITTHGVRLPKLDVPTFDSDILNWSTFWEQFCIAVHDRTHLSDAEKLAYLKHSLKNGAARSTVEGLSCSGDQYAEAVKCLNARYNRPKLIHQAQVKKIVDIPSLKDGSSSELRRLHDTAQQHIRALKALGNEPDGPFITSFLQLKLDPTTLFEWQRHDQDSDKVSGYERFLKFINLRAQASECLLPERSSRPNRSDTPRKNFQPRSATFTAGVANTCIVCMGEKHPFFACPQFKAMPRDKMMSTIRNNELCLNCLKPGHFAKQCQSTNRCRKCEKTHHIDSRESLGATALNGSTPQSQAPPTTSPPWHNMQQVYLNWIQCS